MAPFKQPSKRRMSNGGGRNVRSRTVSRAGSAQTSTRSDSRQSSISRTSSTDSLRGPGRRRSLPSRPSTRSERPLSAATSRTFAGDAQSVTSVEPAPDDDADLDLLGEVVMAVSLAERGMVGCAYYVARDEKLYFMEDVKLGGPDVIDACKCPYLLS